MPIDVKITGMAALEKAKAFFSGAKKRIADELEIESKKFANDAEGRSKKDYLRGPRPEKLDVRTGRLRSSITSRVERSGDSEMKISVGTNVIYARVHELGFRGTVNVRAHDRIVKKAFGRSIAVSVAHVGASARKMNLRQRPFLAPAIDDAMPAFKEAIKGLLEKHTNWQGA